MSEEHHLPTWKRVLGGLLFAIVLGPIMFNGELVGPGGHVHWFTLIAGVVGTLVWIAIGLMIFNAWPPQF